MKSVVSLNDDDTCIGGLLVSTSASISVKASLWYPKPFLLEAPMTAGVSLRQTLFLSDGPDELKCQAPYLPPKRITRVERQYLGLGSGYDLGGVHPHDQRLFAKQTLKHILVPFDISSWIRHRAWTHVTTVVKQKLLHHHSDCLKLPELAPN